MQMTDGKQLHALLVSIVELSAPMRPAPAGKSWKTAPHLGGVASMKEASSSLSSVLGDWQLGSASLAALDEALLEVALPSASLGMTAQLVSLRACLGMPLAPALTRLVEDAVLLQAAGTEATARLLGLIQDAALAEESASVCGEDDEECHAERRLAASSSPEDGFSKIPANAQKAGDGAVGLVNLSELESLSSLLEAASRGVKSKEQAGEHGSKHGGIEAAEEAEPEDLDLHVGSMDMDLLLNKTYMALAMADKGLWGFPHFLLRCDSRCISHTFLALMPGEEANFYEPLP
jgi:hypothetical protein